MSRKKSKQKCKTTDNDVDNNDAENDINIDQNSLRKRLDEILDSVLAGHCTDTKLEKKKIDKSIDSNSQTKNNKPSSITFNDERSSKTRTKMKLKMLRPPNETNTKQELECCKCLKKYKTLNGLKKHKCPKEDRISKTLKMKCSNEYNSNKSPQNLVKHNGKKSMGQNVKQKKVKFTTPIEQVHEISMQEIVPFECETCAEQFRHRRGYLHHRKHAACKHKSKHNLTPILNAIYEDVLQR